MGDSLSRWDWVSSIVELVFGTSGSRKNGERENKGTSLWALVDHFGNVPMITAEITQLRSWNPGRSVDQGNGIRFKPRREPKTQCWASQTDNVGPGEPGDLGVGTKRESRDSVKSRSSEQGPEPLGKGRDSSKKTWSQNYQQWGKKTVIEQKSREEVGVWAAVWLNNRDPPPPPKKNSQPISWVPSSASYVFSNCLLSFYRESLTQIPGEISILW